MDKFAKGTIYRKGSENMIATDQEQNKGTFFTWTRRLEMHLPNKYTMVVCLLSITVGAYFYYSSDRELTVEPRKQIESFKKVVVQMSEYTYTRNTEQLMSGYNFISKNMLALEESPTENIAMEEYTGATTSTQPENLNLFSNILIRCLLLVFLLLIGILLHRIDLYSELQKLLESSKFTMMSMNREILSANRGTLLFTLGLFFVLLTTGQLLLYLSTLIILSAIVMVVDAVDICFIKGSGLTKILDFKRFSVVVLNTTATSFILLLIMEFPVVCLLITGSVIILVGWYMLTLGRQQKDPTDLAKLHHEKIDLKDVLKIKPTSNTNSTLMFVQKLFFLNFKFRDKSIHDYLFKKQHNLKCINPTDTTVIAFTCSTPLLKQLITAKLSLCKLAVPFVFPASKNGKRNILFSPPLSTDSAVNTADCTFEVVSFLRVGDLSVSKSRLINDMLDNDHNTFFSETTPHSKSSRKISEGLIEAAWYEPSAIMKPNLFDDVTLILNLRGDGEREIGQSTLLFKISSVNVVMIDLSKLENKRIKILDNIRKQKDGSFLLLVQNDCNRDSLQAEKIVQENFKDIERFSYVILGTQTNEREFIVEIRDLLLQRKPCEKISINQKLKKCCRIELDEVGTDIIKAKNSADQILKEMFGSHPDKKSLPLQGKHWKDWTDLYKALYKTSESNLLGDDKARNRMRELRQDQASMILDKIVNLKAYIESCRESELNVLWCKFFLHDRSRNGNDSITFDHVSRELGLTYESLHSYKCEDERVNIRDLLQQLQVTMAQMLLHGHVFEIMDGDVGNIPMTWVAAVFHELKEMLKTQRILVMSVIGTEGSAKADLLNILFGSPFLLSETQGVSMQLKQVENRSIPFDIILVIDMQVRHKLQFENMVNDIYKESVKLAVGLGDILLVNIHASSEVETVLQPTMQALQLITKAYSPSEFRKPCFCISHQSPSENLIEQIKEYLANHLDLSHTQTDVLQFSSLISDVTVLKEAILKSSEQMDVFISFQDVSHKIEDLWTGLLKGDNEFIPHFKKRLEERAYIKLAKQCQTKKWKLIRYASDFVAIKTRKCATWSETMTTDETTKITKQLKEEICNQGKTMKIELESFIRNNAMRVTMSTWIDSFLAQIEKVSDKIIEEADESVACSIKRIHQQEKNAREINAEITHLAHLAKTSNAVEEKDLTTMFESKFWTQWSNKCTFEDDKSTLLHLFKSLATHDHGEVIPAAYFRSGISRTILFHVSSVLHNDAELVENILETFSYSKFKLMKDIMIDLAEKADFEEYTKYIGDSNAFAKQWIEKRVNEKGLDICAVYGIVDRLSNIMRTINISDLANNHEGTLILIDRFARHVNESDIHHNFYISKNYFTRMEDTNISRIKELRKLLIDQLEEFKKGIKNELCGYETRSKKIVSDVMDILWGCSAKCVFCFEPCKHTDADHIQQKINHSCIQHRPVAIVGGKYIKEEPHYLNPNFCNRLLKTEETYVINGIWRQIKEYKIDYGDWEILPSDEQSKYWIWFLIEYKALLAKKYECNEPTKEMIPDNWLKVSKLEALDSLSII